MSTEFNLIDASWIPCIRANGQAANLGLREALLQAHELRELTGESPLVTAALHRFLLAVLHRVFGPKDQDAWRALWEARRWDPFSLDAYLTKWHDRFNLLF